MILIFLKYSKSKEHNEYTKKSITHNFIIIPFKVENSQLSELIRLFIVFINEV